MQIAYASNTDQNKKCSTVFVTKKEDIKFNGKAKYGDLKDIMNRGVLVVCAKKDEARSTNVSFSQIKLGENNYVGKDVDLAQNIAIALGVDLEYRMIYGTHDDVIDAVARGKGDVGIADLSFTNERGRKVLFTSPYIESKKTVLVNKIILQQDEDASLQSLLNTESVLIGVKENTSQELFAQTLFPRAKLVKEKNWNKETILQLLNCEIMAVFGDEISIKNIIKQNKEIGMKFIPIHIKNEIDRISAIVNVNSISLLMWLNNFFRNTGQLASVDALFERYGEFVPKCKASTV
ncbi:MAG: transporter substrate-binding domain-containing protein [Holosporales bacterium]|jgi:ABC-type amino acid transport substrate-binding protein|nr:transporter substrate-binding domain-containing protein [Holosporales bacterium]